MRCRIRLERSSRDFSVLARYCSRARCGRGMPCRNRRRGRRASRVSRIRVLFHRSQHVQNTGFAVRRGIAFRCGPDARALALGDRLRRGKELTLFPGNHAKSACSACISSPVAARSRSRHPTGPAMTSPVRRRSCRPGLRRRAGRGDGSSCWAISIATCSRKKPSGRRAIVDQSFWAQIDTANPAQAGLRNAASGQVFRQLRAGTGVPGLHRQYRALAASGRCDDSRLLRPPDLSRSRCTTRQALDHWPVSIRLDTGRGASRPTEPVST